MPAREGLPAVMIVGRPNVGKSTMFNNIFGQRRAIAGDEPGITRDRLYGEAVHRKMRFALIDTGGIVPDGAALIPSEIFKQARVAIIVMCQGMIVRRRPREGVMTLKSRRSKVKIVSMPSR